MKFCKYQQKNTDAGNQRREAYICKIISISEGKPIKCSYKKEDLHHGRINGTKKLYVTKRHNHGEPCPEFIPLSGKEGDLVKLVKSYKKKKK